MPDRKSSTANLKSGQAAWHKGETHAVENTGKTETRVLDIEIKK